VVLDSLILAANRYKTITQSRRIFSLKSKTCCYAENNATPWHCCYANDTQVLNHVWSIALILADPSRTSGRTSCSTKQGA
jgi:hypothetical protein